MPSLRDAPRSLLPEGYGWQLLERLRQRLRTVEILQAIAYYNFTSISNISCSMN
jgi:hypothetical protein